MPIFDRLRRKKKQQPFCTAVVPAAGRSTRMQGEGLIVLEGINGRRKVYTLTETGQEALLAEYRRLKQMVEDSSVLEEDV